MNIALYIFIGFGALVFLFIGFVAWRTIKTPLGQGEGLHGGGPKAGDADKHRHNANID